MRVRMMSTAAGADGLFVAGQEVDVDDQTAIAWLNGGYAESVARQVEQAVVEPKEKAVEHDAATTDGANKRTRVARRRKKSSTG